MKVNIYSCDIIRTTTFSTVPKTVHDWSYTAQMCSFIYLLHLCSLQANQGLALTISSPCYHKPFAMVRGTSLVYQNGTSTRVSVHEYCQGFNPIDMTVTRVHPKLHEFHPLFGTRRQIQNEYLLSWNLEWTKNVTLNH